MNGNSSDGGDAVDECPKCAVCGQPAGQQCGGCRAEHYCSRAHQKQAWRSGHRLRCSTFRMEYDPALGRHLVATRDIKQGETILKEKPAVVGPKMLCYPTCLSCYKRVRAFKQPNGVVDYYKCTSCNWPMCDSKCEAYKVHKEECELMTARKYKSTITYAGQDNRESAYCVISPLRIILMKKSDPKQHEAIMSLQSHLEERIKTPLYRILKANIVTFIQQVLGLSTLSEETILGTAGILDTNAFEIKNDELHKKARGVYLTASLIAHDCNPNTKHVLVDDNHCIAIIASVPISKGSIITTSYTQPLWGTLARRLHLQTVKCISCSCERCKDLTEFGTFLGSINCAKCNPLKDSPDMGSLPKMLSMDPLNNAAEWKCERCEHKIPAKQMTWGNEAIRKEIQMLDRTNPRTLEEFLDKYKHALHSTNYHVLEIKFALTQIYGCLPGFTYNELNDAGLSRKISLCEELLEVVDVLQEGVARNRGQLLLELQAARVVQAKRDLAADKVTKQAAQDMMGECMGMLQEASEILKSEPDMQGTLQNRLQILMEELND